MSGDAYQRCAACFSTSLSAQHGVLTCNECGEQMQAFVEEEQEWQEGVDNSRFRRSTRLTASVKLQRVQTEALSLDDALQCYCMCLQHMLQTQLGVLCSKFGVGSGIVSVARCLWLGYVTESGVLGADFRKAVEASTQADNEAQPQVNGLGRPLTSPRRTALNLPQALSSSLQKALPTESVLTVCMLACWHCREAILPMDLLRWAASGELPYLNMAETVRNVREAAGPSAPLERLLKPQGVPGLHALMADTMRLARALQVQLPNVNALALLRRFILELCMPQALLPIAADLFWTHLADRPQAQLQDSATLGPYAHLVAVLIVATRLCYHLDGSSEVHVPGMPPPPDWQVWAVATLLHMRRHSVLPLTSDEAARLAPADACDYMRTLQETSLAGHHPPDGLSELNHMLLQAGFASKQSSAATASTDGRANVPVKAARDADAAQYRLLGPAWHPVAKRVHADYAVLLNVCAAHLWMKPEFLHAIVCTLETAMTEAELTADTAEAST